MKVCFERPAVWIGTLTIVILIAAVAQMPNVNNWTQLAFIGLVALLTGVFIWTELVSPAVVALVFIVADVFVGVFG